MVRNCRGLDKETGFPHNEKTVFQTEGQGPGTGKQRPDPWKSCQTDGVLRIYSSQPLKMPLQCHSLTSNGTLGRGHLGLAYCLSTSLAEGAEQSLRQFSLLFSQSIWPWPSPHRARSVIRQNRELEDSAASKSSSYFSLPIEPAPNLFFGDRLLLLRSYSRSRPRPSQRGGINRPNGKWPKEDDIMYNGLLHGDKWLDVTET